MSDEARALTMAVLGRPKGYDPAFLTGVEREWYDAKLPIIATALRDAKAQGMEEAAQQLAEATQLTNGQKALIAQMVKEIVEAKS